MRYCELRFAGREFTVLLHLDLLKTLQYEISRALIRRGTLEPGGILLGRGNEGAAILLGCAPQLSTPSTHKRDGRLEILGYYRLASGADPMPEERDVRAMRESLPGSASVLLLIARSPGGSSTGSLFIWEDGNRVQLLAGKTKVHFPNPVEAAFSGHALRPGNDLEQSEPEAGAARSLQDHSLPAVEKDRFRRKSRAASLVWAIAICIAGVHVLAPNLNKAIPTAISEKRPGLQGLKPLALAASVDNGELRVTWDKTSPLISSALSALLSVYTGHREPDTRVLGRDQLMTGTATLPRPPGHAKIRLVVFTEETSELMQRSDPDTPSAIAPVSILPAPDGVSGVDENLPPEENLETHTSVASPAEPIRRKRTETGVKRMAIGFTADDSRGRLAPGKDWVPPRPMRLVQPDPYYGSNQTSLDSVQIRIRVRINAFGAVTGVESLVPRNERIDPLSVAAMRAARESSFVPARFGKRKVPSTAVLSYWFLRRR